MLGITEVCIVQKIGNTKKIFLDIYYKWFSLRGISLPLNNQNNSNSIFLLGYFNYRGIETSEDLSKVFKLYNETPI